MIKGFKYTDIQLNAHEEAYLATVEKILEVEVVPKGTSFRITLLSHRRGSIRIALIWGKHYDVLVLLKILQSHKK